MQYGGEKEKSGIVQGNGKKNEQYNLYFQNKPIKDEII